MRWKDYGIILLCLTIAGGMFYVSALQQEPIRQSREKMGLVMNTSLENAPPSLAFATVAMGAFRGLVVDILWIRADKLKQEGQFFDAKQLAEWITILQPRFASVWDFHSWNMAYNISVTIPNTQPQERWRWVRNGYELLRDKGIPLNPKSIILYRQLAWIFLHKIGDISDDCHLYYKKELALSMRSLLGDNSNAEFDSLAATLDTLEEALRDEEIAKFVSSLQKADAAFIPPDRLVEQYLALRQAPDRFSKEAFAVVDQFRGTEGLKRFDYFARAYQIRNVWKMDPSSMRKMNQTYGPVDLNDPNQRLPLNWEHPAVHAMYWAARGLEVAGRPDQYRVDEKNTDRIIFHGLQMLYRTGKTTLYTTKDGQTSLFLRPDLRMFDSCDQIWKKVIKKYEEFEKGNPKAVRGGHKNFLENAVMSFYQVGHTKHALRVYQELITLYPTDEQGYEYKEHKLSMVEFVKFQLKQEFTGLGIQDATEFITMVLREGYFRYAIHDDDEAAGREKMAQDVYTMYQKENSGESYRLGMPAFEMLRYMAFMDFLNDPEYPQELRMSLVERIKVDRPDIFEKLQKQDVYFNTLLKQQQEKQQSQPQPANP
jgi:hypothetical protein